MELAVINNDEVIANVVFGSLVDRNQKHILSIRDQNTEEKYRRMRLMTLVHIFLMNRFKIHNVHYLTPTEDNAKQCEGMLKRGIYFDANHEVGQIIVATVNIKEVKKFVAEEQAVTDLISEG
jgi:isocitrate lyase